MSGTTEHALPTGLLIDGSWTPGAGDQLDHTDPTTGRVHAQVDLASDAQVDDAVAAARQAARGWRRFPADRRRHLLQTVASLIRRDAEELHQLAALENGITARLAPHLVTGKPAESFDYYAGWADKLDGQVLPSYPTPRLEFTLPEPYGVIGVIITWNAPALSIGMKVAPALAAGNTVVLKPPENAPFTSLHIARLFQEAGFPPGVLNVVTAGPAGGERLVRHPDVAKLTFTGGIPTARKIATAAADRVAPVLFELGGKSAQVVFPDADIDAAVAWGVGSVMMVAGQGCAVPTRLLAHRDVYDRVVDRARAVAERISVGRPQDPSTAMGPLVNAAALERVERMVRTAADDGAHVVAGGARPDGDLAAGFFYRPTILADVDNASQIAQEEVFGPVHAIIPFDTEEEAIDLANDTKFGLAAYVWTEDLRRAHRMARDLEAGTVGVNQSSVAPAFGPFGGIKQSGYGREGGRQGIEEFVALKRVSLGIDTQDHVERT